MHLDYYKSHMKEKRKCKEYFKFLEECGDKCPKPDLEAVNQCNYLIGQGKDYEPVLKKFEEVEHELEVALRFITFRPIIYDEIEHFQTGVSYPFN